MERVKPNLFESVCSWQNLTLAAQRTIRGKRRRRNIQSFQWDFESELLKLQHELRRETYAPGPFRSFEVFDPKRRWISAAPVRDRVVHHAICNLVEPIFEKIFIPDSFANRKGKGATAAVTKAKCLSQRFRYVLKADIWRFFPSVDHQLLMQQLGKRIKDSRLIRLLEKVVLHPYPGQVQPQCFFRGDDLFTPLERTCGIPIGNQTSQFFGNVMLHPLDHFIKRTLGVKGYLRYMDDFVLFGDSKWQLQEYRQQIADYLQTWRLRLHPRKTNIMPVKSGFRFLGFLITPQGCRVPKSAVHRFRRRMKRLDRLYEVRAISLKQVQQSVNGWWGYAKQAPVRKLIHSIIRETSFGEDLFEAEYRKRKRESRTQSAEIATQNA